MQTATQTTPRGTIQARTHLDHAHIALVSADLRAGRIVRQAKLATSHFAKANALLAQVSK